MKKSVAVLGLGKFGSSIARSLAKGGAEVLAVDKDEDLVRDIADKVTCAVCVDISDKEMMNNIGLEGMDAVDDRQRDRCAICSCEGRRNFKRRDIKTCWSR